MKFHYSTFSHKVDNDGNIANFVLPHSCRFLHYLYLYDIITCGNICLLVNGITIEAFRLFISPFNYEWHGQNKVDNIANFVL